MFSIDIRVIQYFIRLFLVFGLYSLMRLLFFLFNWSLFKNATIGDFITGIRFDAVSIAWLFLPFHLVSIIGFLWNKKSIQKTQQFFLFFGVVLSILTSVLDFGYFKFTLKRSTSDVASFFEFGGDIWAILPSIVIDFWYLFFLAALLIYGSIRFFGSTFLLNPSHFNTSSFLSRLAASFMVLGLFLLMARGGLQLIPLKIIDAARFTTPRCVPLVLNTPFCLLKTIGKSSLSPIDYYPENELPLHFNPIQKVNELDTCNFKPLNVIVITLESFSNEFVRSKEKAYLTPFFNQLKSKSLSFENCFANGKKSIEGIPSIYSGLPTLSDYPIITGMYSSNTIRSLAYYLKQNDYETSFFHGGRNGTMNFDAYTTAAGFENYFGMDQYPEKADFDGTWGIYDEPFYDFFIQKLNTFTPPFFSGFFSLSSHHPYALPDQYSDRFNKSKLPMKNAIAYADYALKTFFEKAKKQAWYSNTLFVITADHTPNTSDKFFANSLNQYSIPLLFFYPNDTNLLGIKDKIVQQADIMPSILDYLNFCKPYFSFGTPRISNSKSGFSVQYINGVYQLIMEGYMLQFSNNLPIGLYNIIIDQNLDTNLIKSEPKMANRLTKKLKGIIQQYNNRTIENRLTE